MKQKQMSSLERQKNDAEIDEEIEWIAAARIDPAAFEPLYLRYRTRLYRYLRMRLPSDEDAADLKHQVFLKALNALPHYQQRGLPFSAWLFRIAHHAAVNATRRQPPVAPWNTLPEELHPLDEQDPEARALRQETFASLHAWLTTLSAEKRELLALRFAAGLRVPQIAGILGKKPDAVKKQLYRLLQSYKEYRHGY